MMDKISEAIENADLAIYNAVCERAKANGVKINAVDIVVFLEKEITGYRRKINMLADQNDEQAKTIKNMRNRIDKLEKFNDEKLAELAQTKNQLDYIVREQKALKEKTTETTLEATKESTVAEIVKAISDNGFTNISISIFKAGED